MIISSRSRKSQKCKLTFIYQYTIRRVISISCRWIPLNSEVPNEMNMLPDGEHAQPYNTHLVFIAFYSELKSHQSSSLLVMFQCSTSTFSFTQPHTFTQPQPEKCIFNYKISNLLDIDGMDASFGFVIKLFEWKLVCLGYLKSRVVQLFSNFKNEVSWNYFYNYIQILE